ncbi:MAG: hypothetical protein NVV59_15765 [Chitinophagaceae bacterium]|nr:hypothetical protein [Chitinophagaceae bacterium]
MIDGGWWMVDGRWWMVDGGWSMIEEGLACRYTDPKIGWGFRS